MFKWRLIKRKIRLLWQRLTRGWDDSDTWSLDYTIAKFTLPRLKRFQELKMSHPAFLTIEEWDDVLNKIIFALEVVIDDLDVKSDRELVNEDYVKMQEGLELLGAYFFHLWS